MKNFLYIVVLLFNCFPLLAQKEQVFTEADSLRGTLNPMRTAYDVTYYHLSLKVNPEEKSIQGNNVMHYTVVNDFDKLQVDLFANLKIDSIIHHNRPLEFTRKYNAVFVAFPEKQQAGSQDSIAIYYGGKPIVAKRPPWDGGFVWEKDANENHWIGVAVEGIGASVWWPNKDHPSDEPDSMLISCAVPSTLMCVSNGSLVNTTEKDNGFTRYDWFVSYPINNYNVTLNIAKYAHINDTYTSEDGKELALDYYVLEYNEEKAREHFKQVKPMLACFENSYGKYPFWEDGYALVETPYWGMEHQSAIAYGNNYENNEFGFDFIIIHESAHEYWGNSVSAQDHAELWIHESFATYAEALYVECMEDYETSIQYLLTQKPKIKNQVAILGPLGVNYQAWPDADMYYKGTWMLHSMRNTINNDELWMETIRALYQEYKYSNVSTEVVINFMVNKSGYDLVPIFEQFLTKTGPPTLVYSLDKKGRNLELSYRWQADVKDFNMAMKLKFGNEPYQIIYPTTAWKTQVFKKKKAEDLQFAEELFYFEIEKVE